MQGPAVSLPKGGGAIRGIGEKFSVNPATGTASMTLPIVVSPGRSGPTPQLALSYDSGSGNGVFGFGWTLSLPAISRKTAKGLPLYRDAEESDDFLLSGAEDLVPVLRGDGTREDDENSAPGYTVRRYRPRIDGLFARLERWTRKIDGDVHWRSLSRDNVLSLYGPDAGSRIADPADPRRIFTWLISETRDDRGNAVLYNYKQDDGAGIDLGVPCEHNRGAANDPRRATNRYLKKIRYGNRRPLLTAAGSRPVFLADLPAGQLEATEWMFETVLDYGEHDAAAPTPGDTGAWHFRADPFSSYRSGFEVRTTRLCRRVLMFHHIPDLPSGEPGYDGLVRSLDLTYLDAQDPANARNPIYSLLLGASQAGYRPLSGGGYERRTLPPVEFEYSLPSVDGTVHEVDDDAMENVPAGVDGTLYQWVDLHGEGISGILSEQAGAWFYKRNISPISGAPVAFSSLECVDARPNMALTSGDAQFLDLAGDGLPDLVGTSAPGAGFYEHDLQEGWKPFKAFAAPLSRDLKGANLRLVDLTGDGLPDVLITDDDAIVWHPSLGEEGFGPARHVGNAMDEERGPRLVFADASETIHLADFSGDGLTDLVRIRNGEVCYWPNLGYGRFGAKVTMNSAPLFDRPDQFDHRRVRLGDIDGSGTTDIIYLHGNGVRLYFNQSGNGWSKPQQLGVAPPAGGMVSTVVIDLQGNGTASLIWSSPLANDARRPMRYVNLMGSLKPHLLVRTTNNLGAETAIGYVSSSKYYLQDKRDGKPWLTRLPFPVHVVERIEIRDRIARNRFTTRYAYHHGHFDGVEREFRGFGMVEQWDTEDFAVLSSAGALSPADNEHPASLVAPVHTKTWFHTGIWFGRGHLSDFFAGLLNATDTGEYYREPGLTDAQARAMLLPDTLLPPGLSIDEEREAARALKGAMLRKEVYASDGSARSTHPYTVSEQNLAIRIEQRRGINRSAIFSTHANEAISYHYERSPTDPRIEHALTLEVDAFGNALKEASVAYGRRQPDASLPLAMDRAKQAVPLITYSERRFTAAIVDPAIFPRDHRMPLPCEVRSFELTGYAPTGGAGRFRPLDFVALDGGGALRNVFDSEISYEAAPTGGRQRRTIELHRTLFRRTDMTDLLSLGAIEPLALAGENYKLAFTSGLIATIFRRGGQALMANPATILGAQGRDGGGYLRGQTLKADGRFPATDDDDDWWVPSGRVFLSPGAGDSPAIERAYAQRHFYLPLRTRDAFHSAAISTETLVTYDDHDLLAIETRDAVGNRVTAGERRMDGTRDVSKGGNDYRVLQPFRTMDPNRNRAEVAFDALGMVVATAVSGKPEQSLGDSLAGLVPDIAEPAMLAHLNNPLAAPVTILGRATSRILYDLFGYHRTRNDIEPQPVTVYTAMRETHDADLTPGQTLRVQHGFSYCDGFGREIQKKILAEPGALTDGGPALPVRWTCNGWVVNNNKGKPVQQFQPFFSATHRFEFGIRIGVSPVLFYDPLERVVATLHPNGTYEKVVFDPWRHVTWDVNDTILSDPLIDPDVGGHMAGYFAALSPAVWQGWHGQRAGGALGPDEQNAAAKAGAHANTPSTAHFDVLGRPMLTLADNGPDPALPAQHLFFASRVELDIEGNQRWVRDAVVQAGDPSGRIAMLYAYDMLGNRIHQTSMEAGARWMLGDAVGKPIRAWDDRGHVFRTDYDPLRRPVRAFVTGADPAKPAQELLTERLVYGEQHPDAVALNLRDTLYLQLDQVGSIATEGRDFKGNPLRAARRLSSGTQYRKAVDWAAVDADALALPPGPTTPLDPVALAAALAPLLEADAYVSASSFDAMNRVMTVTTPHTPAMQPSVLRPVYNEAGLLERVDANLHGAASAGQPVWTPFVTGIDYDAKGQRRRIAYGNGVVTTYDYDTLTFRLARVLTRRDGVAFPADCPQPAAAWPGCEIQSLRYTYDPVGNITHVRDEAQQAVFFANQRVDPVADYRYDAVYRLIEATGREHLGQGGVPIAHTHDDAARSRLPQPGDGNAMGTYAERYVYDQVGNMLEMQHRGANPANPGWTRRYAHSETSLIEDGTGGHPLKTGNRLTGMIVGGGAPPPQFVHDAHGNMTRMPHLGGVHPNANLHWNYRDQLCRSDLGGGGTAYYVCDAAGQRIRKVWEKSLNLVEERIYLGGFEIFRRAQGANRLVRETLHIMDDKRRIALVETRTLDTAGTDAAPGRLIRYQFGNHLGSSSLELDDQAQIVSYEEHTPFGSTAYQAVRNQTDTPKRYRFTGKERDEESGLYYYGARYYAPWLGRWTSCDPKGIDDGINTYQYVHNNPVNEVDPSGKDGEPWWRFTQAGAQYQTGRYDMFATHPGYDVGFAPANLVVNLVVTASNICTIPFNAVTEAASIPEMIAREAGASEQDIDAMNFALMMTGVGEVAAIPKIARVLTATTRVTTTVKEVKAVTTVVTEVKAATTVVAEVKAVKTAATEVKALAAPAVEAKKVATAAVEVKTVAPVNKAVAPVQTAKTAKAAQQSANSLARIVDQSVKGERYFLVDSTNSRLYAEASVSGRGELSISLRTELESGVRSTVLKGGEQFDKILQFFKGQFSAIKGNWQFGSNLAKVNELTATGMSLEQAAAQTWTASKAADAGYKTIKVLGSEGAPGAYTAVQVLFLK
ncbi:MAG: SpvB/TcaC N-terminal domain-containing protein [Allorhizobium sp.]